MDDAEGAAMRRLGHMMESRDPHRSIDGEMGVVGAALARAKVREWKKTLLIVGYLFLAWTVLTEN